MNTGLHKILIAAADLSVKRDYDVNTSYDKREGILSIAVFAGKEKGYKRPAIILYSEQVTVSETGIVKPSSLKKVLGSLHRYTEVIKRN